MDPICKPDQTNDLEWARITDKINRYEDSDCWEWIGARSKSGKGYGLFTYRGRLQAVHRLFYQWFVGPIPKDLQLDHLCRNMECVNPQHLEPVTCHENNVIRGQGLAAANAKKTHCPQGHEFDQNNTYVDKTGRRHCRECSRQRSREWKSRTNYIS